MQPVMTHDCHFLYKERVIIVAGTLPKWIFIFVDILKLYNQNIVMFMLFKHEEIVFGFKCWFSFAPGVQLYVMLSPYLCFISFYILMSMYFEMIHR